MRNLASSLYFWANCYAFVLASGSCPLAEVALAAGLRLFCYLLIFSATIIASIASLWGSTTPIFLAIKMSISFSKARASTGSDVPYRYSGHSKENFLA